MVVFACSIFIARAADAAIRVTLTDGVTTKAPGTPLQGFTQSMQAPAGANHTLVLMTGCTAPCTRFFPSGSTTGLSTDTFKLMDISATNKARVEKVDVPVAGTATSGADSVILRGIRIVALPAGAGKTFRITYATQAGDLSTITSSTGNYAAGAKLKGQFRLDNLAPIDGLSGPIAATCDATNLSVPCVQNAVRINLLTLNGTGSSTIFTATVPCSSLTGSVSPCGSGGFYNAGLLAGDQFFAVDSGSVGCGTECQPFWTSNVTVRFSAANQVFTLTNSSGAALAEDSPTGLVDLAVQLSEPGINVWVGSCAGVQTGAQPYRVTALPPFGNLGRNQSDFATFPMKFSLEVGQFEPTPGGFLRFLSISDPAEAVLPPGDRLRNDACSMSWVPSPSSRPQFRNITELTLKYTDFVTDLADSGDPRLGSLGFTDCTACFRVEIDLVDNTGFSEGTLVVYLGSEVATHFQTNHDGSLSPLVLAADPDARVDSSGMSFKPECCITFADAQSNGLYGKLFVRAITVVIDQGTSAAGNHLVQNLEAVVNGNSSNTAMLTVGNFQPSCEWPPADGLKIYVYKVMPSGERLHVLTVLNPTVDPGSCQLKASVNVTDLLLEEIPGEPVVAGRGTYEAHVVAFSAAAVPHPEFIGGIALPDPGIMILK
jgi:hypothetical protein